MKFRNFVLAAAIAATAAAAPLAASAQSLPWPLNAVLPGWANGNWQYGANVPTRGVIASVQGSSFTLQNGTTIFMHQGTVINPTGTRLQPGMSVNVMGTPNGGGRFNANEVDVNGYANGGNYNPYGYGQNNPYSYNGPARRYPDRDRDERGRWQAQHEHWNNGEHRGWQNRQHRDNDGDERGGN